LTPFSACPKTSWKKSICAHRDGNVRKSLVVSYRNYGRNRIGSRQFVSVRIAKLSDFWYARFLFMGTNKNQAGISPGYPQCPTMMTPSSSTTIGWRQPNSFRLAATLSTAWPPSLRAFSGVWHWAID
jgi:hypothetical protein